MNEIETNSVATFFFYVFLDEAQAIEATLKSITRFKARHSQFPHLDRRILLVESVNDVWKKFRKLKLNGRPQIFAEAGWVLPEAVDLGPWKDFHRQAQENELIVVVWITILGEAEAVVAQGLGISVGTIRYRLCRGLKRLGSLIDPVRRGPIGVVTYER